MQEYLRAYIVISALMMLAYCISRALFGRAVEQGYITRLYVVGFAATTIMFLAHNMWLFLSGLALLSILAVRNVNYPLALFVFLLLLMPGYSIQVPGFGLINYLIDLNPWRVLSITLLLPATLHLAANRTLPRPGKLWADKIVITFALYTALLSYVHFETFTGGMRQLTLILLDMVVVYFVASRSLMDKGTVRHVIVALVAAAVFLALVGAFEFAKHWILYSGVQGALGGNAGMFGYLGRGETLRALATTGQPIVLGFIMMVAVLLTSYVQHLMPRGGMRILLWVLMGVGLVAAMSRGPWVGTAIGLFVIALTSYDPLGNVFKLLLASFVTAVLLVTLPGGEKILDYLPWVGSIDAGGIDFREILWQQSMLVIEKSPWIGSIGFTELPEFNPIRLGSGFVDIVNSYLGIVLQFGLIGLALFIFLLLSSLVGVLRALFVNRNRNDEIKLYGIALLAVIIATIAEIWMVSSISQIAPMVTFTIGASAAYGYLVQVARTRQSSGSSMPVML